MLLMRTLNYEGTEAFVIVVIIAYVFLYLHMLLSTLFV